MSRIASLPPGRQLLAKEGLGASEVPTALGLNPFQHAAELVAVKRGELEPAPDNRFTHWGRRLEAVVADEFVDRRAATGQGVVLYTPDSLRHPVCGRLFASLDRAVVPLGSPLRLAQVDPLMGANEGLEIKTTSTHDEEEWGEGIEDVPERVWVQVQVQMEVTGLPREWVAVLFGGNDYREYRIERDPQLGGELVEFASKWWSDHVVQGIPVPVDGSAAASAFVKRRWPRHTPWMIEPTHEIRLLAESLRDARRALKDATEMESEIGNALRQLIGSAQGAHGVCTFKNNKDSVHVDYEAAFKSLNLKQAEQVLQQFTTTSPGARVLRLAKEK